MFGKLMSVSDELMDRYYLLLLGEVNPAKPFDYVGHSPSKEMVTHGFAMHPMDAKKALAERLTARYHGAEEAAAARADWDTRFSKKNLAEAELPELSVAEVPSEATVLSLSAFGFRAGFGLEKSNGELRKQFITTGAVQLNGEKLTDPAAPVTVQAGDVLKLSKKHAVRFR
jgi:tyrosyl-tRNA synthetase